jgi:hypothetical protein
MYVKKTQEHQSHRDSNRGRSRRWIALAVSLARIDGEIVNGRGRIHKVAPIGGVTVYYILTTVMSTRRDRPI